MSWVDKVLKMVRVLSCIAVIFACMAASAVNAAELLKDNHPSRYVIKKGDTLWDISGKFLNDPWRWPEIWKKNQDISNPDLIYPDDVLILSFVDGQPVLRKLKQEKLQVEVLRPEARAVELSNAILPVSPRAIKPFYIKPLVTTQSEVQTSAYIVDGVNDRLVGGKGSFMYARGLKETSDTQYHIFRGGRNFIHPLTGEVLGKEAIDIGTAKLVAPGDVAKIRVLSSREGVEVGDLVKPVNGSDKLPFFFPAAHPDIQVNGVIMASEVKTAELGPTDVVTITLGERENVVPGHVFKIFSGGELRKDRISREKYHAPFEEIGLLMVIRSFEKVSYAIIMNATQQITTGNIVAHPKANLTLGDVIPEKPKKNWFFRIFNKN